MDQRLLRKLLLNEAHDFIAAIDEWVYAWQARLLTQAVQVIFTFIGR